MKSGPGMQLPPFGPDKLWISYRISYRISYKKIPTNFPKKMGGTAGKQC